MDSREIKALLVSRGIKQVDIAADIGVSRGYVSAVISGTFKSERIQRAISDITGVPYSELWGD